ncbi:MAG: competence/damage-inducible protein A [Alphaproteobacteria bacterium]|nr:MAG: competence/damage-inducible protein A [Alphaproteobacteria bacterium]
MAPSDIVTAAVLVIGDEILSGRTKDKNIGYIATWLGELGIQVKEARVVPDIEQEIVDAVNALRARYTYVFTTGGIGPTHDDITADSIAKAFGVGIDHHPEVVKMFEARYDKEMLNEARLRMARIPDGASLIENPISKAPGFRLENVFVMAGIPMLVEAMLESLRGELVGGARVASVSLSAHLAEGDLAKPLGRLQEAYPDVSMGSYPFYRGKRYGVTLVLRSSDLALLDAAAEKVMALMRSLGQEPEVERG